MGEVNLIRTAAAVVLVAIVITLAAFALVNLVNATTALGERLAEAA